MKMESNEKLPQSSEQEKAAACRAFAFIWPVACCKLPVAPQSAQPAWVTAWLHFPLNCLGPQAQLVAQVRIYLFIYCERNVYQQIAIIVSCSWQRAAERGRGKKGGCCTCSLNWSKRCLTRTGDVPWETLTGKEQQPRWSS